MIFMRKSIYEIIKSEGGISMGKQNMSKKLRQAVEHANETNPSSRAANKPHTSRSERVGGK
jgi:hypothetical protein